MLTEEACNMPEESDGDWPLRYEFEVNEYLAYNDGPSIIVPSSVVAEE